MEGFVVRSWATAQQEYFSAIGSCSSGQVWSAQLIGRLWKLGRHMWEHRNVTLHQGSTIPQLICERRRFIDAVRAQFAQGLGDLDQRYARWFRGTADDLLNRPRRFTSAWLRNVVAARGRWARRDSEDPLSGERACLACWLHGAPVCRERSHAEAFPSSLQGTGRRRTASGQGA